MSSASVFLLLVTAAPALADPNPDPRMRRAEALVAQGRLVEGAAEYQALYQEGQRSGAHDERQATIAASLAAVDIFIERYREAEPLLKEAIAIDRELFGAEGLQTARRRLALARLYAIQHRVPEVEQILSGIRPQLERAENMDTKTAAAVFNDLGLVDDGAGRLSQAVKWYRRSIELYGGMNGSHQTLMAMTLLNLSAALVDQALLPEAADAAAKGLSIMEKAYGPDHLFTARALTNLGLANQAMHRNDEAQKLYERALSIWEKNPGVADLEAASVEASLGALYADLGYYPKAEVILRQSLANRERRLGPDAEEVAGVLNNLGVLHANQGRRTEAAQELERAVAIEQTFGANPARTAPVIANLAAVYFADGQYRKDCYAKAEKLFRRVLDMQEQRFGPDHILVATALMNLAQTCAAQKNYREAKQLESRAVAIRQAALGPKHPDTIQALRQYTLLMRQAR